MEMLLILIVISNFTIIFLNDIKHSQGQINQHINSFLSGENGCHITDEIFRCIFCEWKVLIEISLKFVPNSLIDNNLVLV